MRSGEILRFDISDEDYPIFPQRFHIDEIPTITWVILECKYSLKEYSNLRDFFSTRNSLVYFPVSETISFAQEINQFFSPRIICSQSKGPVKDDGRVRKSGPINSVEKLRTTMNYGVAALAIFK